MDARRRTAVRIGVWTALAACLGAALYYRRDAAEWLAAATARIRDAGLWGAAALGLLYVPACVLMLPGAALSIAAGAAFGLAVGTVAVSLGSTLGASAAFLVSRYVARPWVEARIAANSRFRAIDRAVGRQGFRIVLLTRLSPIFPFNVLNYAYGVTNVSFTTYVLASWLGMLPGTVMYVYLGTAAGKVAEESMAGSAKPLAAQALFYVGLAASVIAVAVVARTARAALASEVNVDGGA